MAKVWDKPITAETDWGGDASTDNLPVSGRQVQAWIKSNIKSDAQISQLLVSWLNTHTINSPVFWKGLPIDADTLSWDGDKLTVIGSDGESQPIDEQFLINFLQENGYLTKGDYPFVYDAEKKAWLFTGDLVATGAITMFGDFNKFKPSTIMDAVQVDDITIGKTAEGVLYAKSGGGSGGSGMSYEEINQIVSNAIQNKADKATTLEGYGIENAYDKSYIDTLAYKLTTVYNWGDHSKAGYVFKDTKQDISARHNFTNGIEIGGLAAYKSKDDVVFLDANLVVRGAITMYGDNGTTSKTIWENIPFDSTMQWNGSTWSVVGGGGSSINEDAVNLLIGEYLTNNNYASEQWVSNQGYAKQSSLDGVDNRLKSVETFFATSDTDNLVNKWSEIVTFLNATEGDTLDNILKTKANQSALDDAVASLTTEIGKKWTQNDIKIANWDSAYGWGNHANAGYAAKTYVDGELAKYVKLATAQTISARHNFSDGLQIGGITIRKSQDGVVYIDGNLVIKGAMTMFGTDATIPSSIWASIPFDSTMKWNGSTWSVVGGGSGSVSDATVNNLIYEYLTKNSYATQSWVQNQGYLTTHQSISHLLSKTDAANTYQPIINSSNKLAYSLISGIPDLSVYFRSSDFTKANIKSTLGISDWALAATKPSYTAAEVGALATSGGTITADSIASFTIYRNNGVYSAVHFYNTQDGQRVDVGYLGAASNGRPVYLDSGGNVNDLIHSGNIGSYNAGTATKLQTPRTIWGQSFDGSGDVSGDAKIGAIFLERSNEINVYGSDPTLYLNYASSGNVAMCIGGGNVTIGGVTGSEKLNVQGNVLIKGGDNPYLLIKDHQDRNWYIQYYNDYISLGVGFANSVKIDSIGNLIVPGAITMFSQLSMKNVIDYDGLSLAQLKHIRPARFTWKDGRDNRIHVGGIADYIQPIIPEVIYQTPDDKLTMDYGSAAFYVGASLIKPVVELWEAKDNHEKRIAELERENKRKDEVIAILQNKLNQLRA